MKHILLLIILFILNGCTSSYNNIKPAIIPNSAKEKEVIKVMPENVIGAVEPIYILPMKSPFISRVDTGAAISSIDATNIQKFERDGKSWVSFTLKNRSTGETHQYELPAVKKIRVKRIGENEKRISVELDVKFAGKKFKTLFTLAERKNFEYQGLIGRNILEGRAIVDVSLANTLR